MSIKNIEQYFEVINNYSYLKILLAAIIAISSVSILKRMIHFFFNRTNLLDRKKEDTFESMLFSFVKYGATLGFLFYSLTVVGVKIGNLLAGAGVVGIIVGFSARSLIKDFLTGIFLLYEKQLNQGDVVTINNMHRGTVESIGLRFLKVRKWSGKLLTISHGQIQFIENLSFEKMRIIESVTVSFYEDPDKIFHLLEQASVHLNNELDVFLLKDENDVAVEPFTMYGMTSLTGDYHGYQYTITGLVGHEHYFTARKQAKRIIAKALYESGVRMAEQHIETRMKT